ncbi:MarR family winged helix-turn-helix transcriptional regulator [Aneurinibacillus tyrosinisolvens]|uniref:MarR family winged helix-turn-helix transcriptional regulator n=1 Tax=Aneurinibacillus tyrosinisolvens TaxID=1443435 RepID=UPI00069A9EE3|nr:MarR family transcriptional regulator [Aneurinibacillus tyrosinisolvens]
MEDAIQKWMALDELHGTLNQRLEKFLKTHYNLTVSEFSVISVLNEDKGSGFTVHQLSKMVNLSHSAISRLVARLETCNTVERRSSDTDRRNTVVRLSEQGRIDYKATLPGIANIINDVFNETKVKIMV